MEKVGGGGAFYYFFVSFARRTAIIADGTELRSIGNGAKNFLSFQEGI